MEKAIEILQHLDLIISALLGVLGGLVIKKGQK